MLPPLSVVDNIVMAVMANFGRTKNDDAKQRKIATEYVALCGYKHGEMGRGRKTVDNRLSITQAEIAEQLDDN